MNQTKKCNESELPRGRGSGDNQIKPQTTFAPRYDWTLISCVVFIGFFPELNLNPPDEASLN
jgi:hypothetical protein